MGELCEKQLEDLRQAVREHVLEMDGIMKGPASYARGQQIAASVSRLEHVLSGSALPAPGPAPGSAPSMPAAKPSSPVASGPARKKRKQA